MSDEALEAAVAGNRRWYHSIELAPGVVTPGQVDHRRVASRILPGDLRGKRALDVGTFDGFWAFAMEARGAEVVATDVETIDAAQWPPMHRERLRAVTEDWDVRLGRGFTVAAGALRSHARRVVCDVHALDATAIGGPVDLAFMGALTLHLRDPVGALERVASTLKPGGTLIQMEGFSPWATLLAPRTPLGRFSAVRTDFNWWWPNVSLLKTWPWAAGLVDVKLKTIVRPKAAREMRGFYAVIESRRPG